MSWELDRHDWTQLQTAHGSAERVPRAITALRNASSPEEASRAYWNIDNVVVVQGRLFQAAAAAVPCLLAELPRCTAIARPYILEMLVQLGQGYPSHDADQLGSEDTVQVCLQELTRGVALFFTLLEDGDGEERVHCVDLLGLCAAHDTSLKERAHWHLSKLLSQDISEGLRKLTENWLEEI